MPFNGVGKYAIVDYLLRSAVTAVLALGISLAASYQVVFQHKSASPVINWAGIIVGVYFGAQMATRGDDRRRHLDQKHGRAE